MRLRSLQGIFVLFVVVSAAPAVQAKTNRSHHRAVAPVSFAPTAPAPGFFGPAAPAPGFIAPAASARGAPSAGTAYESMIAAQASANGVPASLIHRVIMRESRYNARAVHAGNYGLMQIKLGTARAMGYSGSASGLLDPTTNMTYAVRYLAGAYRAAGQNERRAVALYSSGYYRQAKAQGLSPYATPTLQ